MRGVCLVILSAAFVVCPAARAEPKLPTPIECDLERTRLLVQREFPSYDLVEATARQGFVTLLFRSRNRTGAFALVVRAAGTRISSSVMGTGHTDHELATLSKPVERWWENSDVLQSLAACCALPPSTALGDPNELLRTTLRDDLVARARSTFHAPPWAAVFFGGAWLALIGLSLGIVRHAADTRTLSVALAGVCGVSLLTNLTLCTGGPGDLRLNLAAIWGPDELEVRWGPAPVALFRAVGLVLGDLEDTHIRWVNLLVSSLLPALVYAILTELAVRRRAALLAALLVAAHPLMIAFSADLGRQPTYLLAALGSLAGLLAYLNRGGAGRLWAFALGTVLAATSRPEGAHVLVLALAILLLAASSGRRRLAAGGVLALVSALIVVYLLNVLDQAASMSGDPLNALRAPTALLWTVVLDADFTPAAWIVMWILGLAIGFRRPSVWVATVSVLGLHVAWAVTGLHNMFVGYVRQVASARYESILLLPFAIGMAHLIEAVLTAGLRGRMLALAAFAVLTLMTYGQPYQTLLEGFTVDAEYQFLRNHAAALPPESRLYVLQSPIDDIGFIDAPFVGPFVGSTVRFAMWDPAVCAEVSGDSSNRYLYIGSSCAPLVDLPQRSLGLAYVRWLWDCARARERLVGGVIEAREVPARSMSWHRFAEPTVHLGLYRLRCPSGSPSSGMERSDGR